MWRFFVWLKGGERVDAAWRRWRRKLYWRWRLRWQGRRWGSARLLLLVGALAALVSLVPMRDWRDLGHWGDAVSTLTAPRWPGEGTRGDGTRILCPDPYVVDGDTIHCVGRRIRLAGIDAPEMPGHCRSGRECVPGDPFAAREALAWLARGGIICRAVETDSYGRTVARCAANGRDLSCAMIAVGHAVRRYGSIVCP